MDLTKLTDQQRLVLGLRFRLDHIRRAIAEVKAGDVPEGFDFAPDDTADEMLAELRLLETDVQRMLRDNGASDSGALN